MKRAELLLFPVGSTLGSSQVLKKSWIRCKGKEEAEFVFRISPSLWTPLWYLHSLFLCAGALRLEGLFLPPFRNSWWCSLVATALCCFSWRELQTCFTLILVVLNQCSNTQSPGLALFRCMYGSFSCLILGLCSRRRCCFVMEQIVISSLKHSHFQWVLLCCFMWLVQSPARAWDHSSKGVSASSRNEMSVYEV